MSRFSKTLILTAAGLLGASPASAQFWTDSFESANLSSWIVTTSQVEQWGLVSRAQAPGLQRTGEWAVWNWAGGDRANGSSDDGQTSMTRVIPEAAGRQGVVISLWAYMPDPAAVDNEDWFAIGYRLSSTAPLVLRHFARNNGWLGWSEYHVPVTGTPTDSFEILIGAQYSDLESPGVEVLAVDDVALFERPVLSVLLTDDFEDGNLNGWTLERLGDTDGNLSNDTEARVTISASLAHSGTRLVYAGIASSGRTPNGTVVRMSRIVPVPQGQGARVSLWIKQDNDPDDFESDDFFEIAWRLAPDQPWQYRWQESDELMETGVAGDGEGLWEQYVTDVPLASPTFEIRLTFRTTEDFLNYFLDDIEVVAIQGARAQLARDLPDAFIQRLPLTATLTALRGSGGEVVTTEGLPAGLTPADVRASTGTVAISSQTLVWQFTPERSSETLTYSVTPPLGGAIEYFFSGSYSADPAWGAFATGGDFVIADATPLGGTLYARINFQPETEVFDGTTVAVDVPYGYLPDFGQPYAARGNRFIYGWLDGSATPPVPAANTETRHRGVHDDQRYDTLNHMQRGALTNAMWEIAVPNGQFDVLVVGGDPAFSDSFISYQIEGVVINRGWGTQQARAVVPVADGRLSIRNGPLASNNKIMFMDIYETPIAPPQMPEDLSARPLSKGRVLLAWTDASLTEIGFLIERREDGGEFRVVGFAERDLNMFIDEDLAGGVSYTYRILAYNRAGESPYTGEVTSFAGSRLTAVRWNLYK